MNPKIIDEIFACKEERNKIVHSSCLHKYDGKLVKEIAFQGNTIVKKIISESNKVTRMAKKVYGEEL